MNRKNVITNNIKRACALDSMYSLFLYLLLSSEEEIQNTFFFIGSGVSQSVKEKLAGRVYYVPNYKWLPLSEVFILLWLYYLYFPLRFPFLLTRNLERWSGHSLWECAVIRKHPYFALEDGLLNYIPYTKGNFKKIKNFLFGPTFRTTEYIGMESSCKKIYLTGLADSIITKQSNVKIINLLNLWNESNEDKKRFILQIMGISLNELNNFKHFKRLLLTQPLDDSNSKLMTESEKIDLYRSFFNIMGKEGFLIKPHPRESTDYSLYFPNISVFKQKIPFEVLSVLGIKFNEVYSVSSTAIFDIPYNCNIFLIKSNKTRNLVDSAIKVTSNKGLTVRDVILID